MRLISLILAFNLTGVVFGAAAAGAGETIDRAILDRLRDNDSSLTELRLRGKQIEGEGAQALAEALRENTSLTELFLHGNQLGAAGATALAEALTQNTSLTNLYFSRNQIGHEGVIALAWALKVNTSLTDLYLNMNQIGVAGARALAEALKENISLTTLNLYNNQIGDAGARALAEALRVNTSLTELNIGSNQIGHEGGIALAEALKVNQSLTALYLFENEIGAALSQRIDRLMSPEVIEERRLNTFWYPGDMLALEGPRATHVTMHAWGLAPQLNSVVFTVFWCEERLLESLDDNVLPFLTDDIWIEIFKMLKCRDFGEQQALLAP